MTGLVKWLIPPFMAAPFLRPVQILSSGPMPQVQSLAEIGSKPAVASFAGPIRPSLEFEGLLLMLWISAVCLLLLAAVVSTIRWRMILSSGIPVENRDGIRI